MNSVLEMHLDKEVFKLIKNGKKTVEMRLNDEKRRGLKVGDRISFLERGSSKKILCEIVKLHPYNNFEELYADIPKEKLGYTRDDIASPADMNLYYTYEEVSKYGVLGIELKVIE